MASCSKATQNQIQPENAFDQLASYSASPHTNKLPCDIFINHRGSDVKYTLATVIYHTFDGMGLKVFLDKEALEPGDVIPAEIQQAMTSASLHIAIFSNNYAQSPWCLAELLFMLKTGAKIIPIFYHVEPSDIRWIVEGKGIYADAFSQHQEKGRYTSEKLQEWKKALHDISFRSGYVVRNNDDESSLFKNVVNCALRALKKVPLEVAKHPVGLDELVKDFEKTILQSAESHKNVKIVGIVGMGGSGKTTLSKELFNKKCSSYDRCSFIFEVRDGADKNALHKKQKKLLEDLSDSHRSFDNVEEGKCILSNRFKCLRALIILDDVDHIDQLDALLPNINTLASDSLVIVTSKDLGVLMSWGISCNYRMPEMNRSHAKQLFCWHAFLQPFPYAGFESLVEKFLMACNGLPLSLKVLGGQLYKKSKGYWECQLGKILRILPSDIRQRLQISYDALDVEEREIFLDVACFFIGKPKSLAIAVWDGSGWSGLHSWETLLNKCLVETYSDKEDCIWMHDHLRDMGRQIACTQSPYRLQNPDQILNIREIFQERILVRGIEDFIYDFVSFKEHMLQLNGHSRRRFKLRGSSLGLKILHVQLNPHDESSHFTEEFASLSEHLVWLSWYDFQERYLPSWLSLRNISVLELFDAYQLEELWEDNVEPPLQLRELRITNGFSVTISPRFKRFPSSIGHLKHLKKIIFTWGFSGSNLPEEFCGIQSLEHLVLTCSETLSSLPADFGYLINLRHINLSRCKQLRMLPDSFKQLIHLEYLDLSYCEMLCLLPTGLGDLIYMQHLDLRFCRQLTVLPDSFKQLIYLKYLDLSFCKMLTSLPAGFGCLINLRHINFTSCSGFKMLPDSFKHLIHLEYLNLSNCRKLKLRPDMLENITKLEYLNLVECEDLEDLPHQIINQGSLRELDIWGCNNLRYVPVNIGTLCKLEKLRIGSQLLTSLPTSLGNLSSLNTLRIECSLLTNLPCTLANLSSLTELNISRCEKLERLPHCMGRHDLLHQREILFSAVRELPFNAGSSSTIINLKEMRRDTEVSEISAVCQVCCSASKTPSLVANTHLMEIGTLPTSLNSIELEECKMLKNIRGVAGLLNLEELKIYNCPELDELPSFADLASLKVFGMHRCPKVDKIEGLELCRSLQNLYISDCRELDDLPSFTNLVSLKAFVMRCCQKVHKIEGLEHCRSLEEIDIDDCKGLDGLPSFTNLTSLKAFKLQGCPKIKKIEGLENLRSLQILRAHTRWEVAGIQSLEKVERLKELNLTCDTISAIKPCIQSIKELPFSMELQGRALRFLRPIVNSFEFPDVTKFQFRDSFLWYMEEAENNDAEGKVVHISVYKEDSNIFPFGFYEKTRDRNESFEYTPALLAAGETARVVEAFYQLLALLD